MVSPENDFIRNYDPYNFLDFYHTITAYLSATDRENFAQLFVLNA